MASSAPSNELGASSVSTTRTILRQSFGSSETMQLFSPDLTFILLPDCVVDFTCDSLIYVQSAQLRTYLNPRRITRRRVWASLSQPTRSRRGLTQASMSVSCAAARLVGCVPAVSHNNTTTKIAVSLPIIIVHPFSSKKAMSKMLFYPDEESQRHDCAPPVGLRSGTPHLGG